jgi:DNA adenine methylase
MDLSSKSRDDLIAICKLRKIKGYSGKNKEALVGLINAPALQNTIVDVAAAPAAAVAAVPVTAAAPVEAKNKSPLRYPGGKTRAVAILDKYVSTHFPGRKRLLSPFFGGGSFELFLAAKGFQVYGNDLFKPLYIFWKTVKTQSKELAALVKSKMPISKEKFASLRAGINGITSELEIAASYYIINRCSFSGATFCGGFSEQASVGRLNESSLKTLENTKLAQVSFSNSDCNLFLDGFAESDDLLIYADPPYYITTYIYGKDGDLHEGFDHAAFAAKIKSRKAWIVSYNDCPYIRGLYAGCRIFTEKWSYGMNKTKDSSEIIILPPLV